MNKMIEEEKFLAEVTVFLLTSFGDEKYVFLDEEDQWHITQEWLVGGFAGREFVASTLKEAVRWLIDYLNIHVGHNSIVGQIVTESGWPDLDAVYKYIHKDDGEEEE